MNKELIDKAAKALAAWPDAVRISDDKSAYFQCPRISLNVTAIRMAGIPDAEAENRIIQIVNEQTETQPLPADNQPQAAATRSGHN